MTTRTTPADVNKRGPGVRSGDEKLARLAGSDHDTTLTLTRTGLGI